MSQLWGGLNFKVEKKKEKKKENRKEIYHFLHVLNKKLINHIWLILTTRKVPQKFLLYLYYLSFLRGAFLD